MSVSKNQLAWEILFQQHQILAHIDRDNHYVLSAQQINQIREARLMTKFDHSNHLPDIFAQHDIAILPISRGAYQLGRYQLFHPLERAPEKIIYLNHHNTYQSLDFDNIHSETLAVNCAYSAGIFADFLGAETKPTVSGRMSSHCFTFQINSKQGPSYDISVNNAQIEIDAGFENASSFVLVEAKNYLADDFVIRQLYYPYRRWAKCINKPIRMVFLNYSNGLFELREYRFAHLNAYNSIHLLKSRRYAINTTPITINLLRKLMYSTAIATEPQSIPFPQADSFERLINLCELLDNHEQLCKNEITNNYGFNKRQTDYYLNACRYLGLVSKHVQAGVEHWQLSPAAKAIFRQPIGYRQQKFIELLLSRKVFREALQDYLDSGALPNKASIINMMRQAIDNKNYAISTYERRATTVLAWLTWVADRISCT